MKLTADRRELAEALKWVALALSTRPQVPALAGIRIDVTAGGVLTLTGHDFDTSHEAVVEAEVGAAGTAVVPGFMVRDLVGALKSPTVELTADGNALGIKAGRSSYSVAGFPLADWPQPPTSAAAANGTVEADVLARGLAQVANVADDDNPVSRLAGVRIEAEGGVLSIVGLRTSAIVVARGEWTGERFSAQLPLKSMAEAARGLSGPVQIGATDSTLELRTDSRAVVLRQYLVEPTDWRRVIPERGTEQVEVEAELLLDAAKRAALTCDKDDRLTLAIGDGELVVTAGSASSGHEVVDCTGEGTARAEFSPQVLLGSLSVLPAGPITLALPGADQRPSLQLLDKAEDVHHVVMPLRARS